jgi:hypothetical protein
LPIRATWEFSTCRGPGSKYRLYAENSKKQPSFQALNDLA